MHSIDGVERLTGEHLYVVTNHEDVDGRLQSLELDFVLRRPRLVPEVKTPVAR